MSDPNRITICAVVSAIAAAAAGYAGGGFGELSKAADQVLGEQLERLKKVLLGG
jgi:hypothetical protein